MATFVNLYGRLLDRELGSADRTELFTTAERKAAINEAQGEFNRLTECFIRQNAAIALTDGTQEYDLEAVITAADYLWIAAQGVEIKRVTPTSTYYYVGESLLPRRDIEWLNRMDPGWRTAPNGIPTSHYLREDGGSVSIGFSPTPSIAVGETWTLIVPYVATIPDMSADSDEPFTLAGNAKISLRAWHQGLVHYAAAKLELMRKNVQGEAQQMQKFAGYVADYLQRHRVKGGRHVLLGRRYYQERASRGFVPIFAQDPRRWP